VDEFQPCGYTVRLSAKWAVLGAVCPKHGVMDVEKPEPESDESDETEQVDKAVVELVPA
jgi:hypothetical protein